MPASDLDGTVRELWNFAGADVSGQLERLVQAGRAQLEALGENTLAVSQNTKAQTSGSGKSAAGEIARTASGLLGSGFGLSPLLTGLIGLFRGSEQTLAATAPLATYTQPPAIRFDGALSRQSGQPVYRADYEQGGLPRAPQATTSLPPITVQVQAMDSRSFLDHSDEIARAVREAMLNAHALNDVVNEW
ncbi:MAG TPA: hypothetical protein VLE22_10930 [Bryobacteraceae bacterium]|nr:hypothetical protein [Bryobacteraceae bacterium]